MVARTRPYPRSDVTQETLHAVPFRLKDVGLGLLPLHEPLKPGLTEVPAAIELL